MGPALPVEARAAPQLRYTGPAARRGPGRAARPAAISGLVSAMLPAWGQWVGVSDSMFA